MIKAQPRGHFPREATMVHLYPDYPEPLREIEKPRGCSGGFWLALVFFLMLTTMIGMECLRRSSITPNQVTITYDAGSLTWSTPQE